MPTIPTFPEDLVDRHHAWHNPAAHPGLPTWIHLLSGAGTGLEFFTFHRDYIAAFHAWYHGQPFADPAAVAPWTPIPPELKDPAVGWNSRWAADEDRIVNNPSSFATADELGIFVEQGIHYQFLHGAAAQAYNEPVTSVRFRVNDNARRCLQIDGRILPWRRPVHLGTKPAVFAILLRCVEVEAPHSRNRANSPQGLEA